MQEMGQTFCEQNQQSTAWPSAISSSSCIALSIRKGTLNKCATAATLGPTHCQSSGFAMPSPRQGDRQNPCIVGIMLWGMHWQVLSDQMMSDPLFPLRESLTWKGISDEQHDHHKHRRSRSMKIARLLFYFSLGLDDIPSLGKGPQVPHAAFARD